MKKISFEKYLSAKSILLFSSLNYFQAALSFVVSFLLARHLEQGQYGLYTYSIVFTNMFSVLTQFGMEKTLVRDLVQLNRPERIINAASIFKASLAIILIIPTLFWAWFFADFVTDKSVIVTIAVIGGSILGISPRAWFDYSGKIHRNAIYSLLDRLLFLIATILLIFFFDTLPDMVVWIVAFSFLGRLLGGILEWSYLLKNIKGKFSIIKSDLAFVAKENIWVWLAAIGNLFMTQANQLILDDVKGAATLALYGFAFQFIMLIRLLQSQILRLTTPSIAEITKINKPKVIISALLRYSLLSVGLTLVLVIPIYLFAPTIIRLLVGEKFLSALPVLNTLLIWITFYGVAIVNNQFLLSLRLQKYYFYVTLFFGLFSLLLAYYFIGKYAEVGAAYSLIIAHFASIIVQLILVLNRIFENEKTTLTDT